jgi:hypothetical protein
MGIAPFCLILNRLLSPVFHGGGALFVIAVLAIQESENSRHQLVSFEVGELTEQGIASQMG